MFFLFLRVEEFFGTQYQSGSFSLMNVGSGFHYLWRVVFTTVESGFHVLCSSSLFDLKQK